MKTVKKAPGLKLDKTAATIQMGTEEAEFQVLSTVKGVSLAELGISDVVVKEPGDDWEHFGDFDPVTGKLRVCIGNAFPDDPATSRATLVFHFENSDQVWEQNVKVTRVMPKAKLSKTGLTINKNYRDTGVVNIQPVTNGNWGGFTVFVKDNEGDSVGADELSVRVEETGEEYSHCPADVYITAGRNADPKKTYTVTLYNDINWLADRGIVGRIKVKVIDQAVTAAPKATGKLDSFQPQSAVVVKPNFKNLTGQQAGQVKTAWNLFDSNGDWYGYMVQGTVQPDGSLELTTDIHNPNVLPAGKYTLNLTYTLRDGTVLEASVPVNATQTPAKLKLGKTSVVLNPGMGNVAVSALPTAKGFGQTHMGVIARDAAGNQVETYDLPFFVNLDNENGQVVLSPKSWAMPETDATYRLTLFPDDRTMEKNGVVLTVKVLGKAAREAQKAALTVTGTLDPAAWNSTVTVTPKISGVANDIYYQDCVVTLESSTNGKTYTEVKTFSVEKTDGFQETGKITLSQKEISLDPALKYRVTVSYQNSVYDTFATGTAQLKLKQTAPKLKAEGTVKFQKNNLVDYDLTVGLTNSVKGQNPIAEVRVAKKMEDKFYAYYEPDSKQLFIMPMGDTSQLKSTTLPIEVFLEGNKTNKPNGTVNVKVTVQ